MEGTQLETVLNSKRQRRPSVRLGEIGDVPLAFFLENRPLKRRKKRVAGTVTSSALVPAVVEEDDGNMEAVDFEEDDDPSGVDMTGFNLRDSARLETCWPQKTKPLEEVEVAAAAAEEISEEGLMVEIAGGNNNVDEPEPEFVDEAGVENGKKGSERRKKRSVKKGKRRAGAASKSWRARKVAAEEVARKAMSKKAVEASLLSENGSDSALKDQDQDHEQEEDHNEETTSAREEDQGDAQERQPDGLTGTETGGEKQDTSQEKNVLEDSLDSDVGDVLGENYEGAIVIASQEKQEQQQQQRQQKEEGHLADESFVLPGFVKKWLEERRLGKFSDMFECHEVDEEVLPLLTMEDLREMGVQTVGSRRKLLHAIQGLPKTLV